MNFDDPKIHQESSIKDYVWFLVIIFGIFLVSLAIYYFTAFGSPVLNFMRIFMAVFFLIFASFKFLDLDGFADSYVNYDVVAAKFRNYAYAYPFIELGLSACYFLNIPGTNLVTVVVMAVGSYGIAKQLLRGNKIKCACLGTFVMLPLSTVSLVEDALMGLMALIMIVL